MKVDDFQLCKDDNGVEFVQFTEGQTKTRQGGLHTKHRDFQPRMFAVGGERCPVALFKQFVSCRPQKLKTTGPFYLSIKTNRRPDDNVWFKVQPMGENKINDMMKSIVADTILESSDKKFTNNSARKTVVGKLKKANVERSGIVKAAKYEIQKPSTCRATLFRCKFSSMFPVFHLARSTFSATKTFVAG